MGEIPFFLFFNCGILNKEERRWIMKFGIVGTNFISHEFVKAAQQMEGVSVVGVCSGSKENAEKFAAEYHISKVFDDYISMMESKEIEGIYLGVPNSMHYEMTMECLKRNIPTFTEKPFASNTKEARKMLEFSEQQGVYVHDGFVPAYTKNIKRIKDEIKKIGPIRRCVFSFEKYSSRYDQYLNKENPTTFRRELSNGSLMDIGVYPIGVSVLLFGKPNKITATGKLLESGVDCMGTCLLQYEGFEVVVLHSKVTNTHIRSEIQGEDGIIQIDTISQMKGLNILKRGEETSESIKDETVKFIYQIENFIQNVQEGNKESKELPHQTTLDILEVIEECRKQVGVVYPADERGL